MKEKCGRISGYMFCFFIEAGWKIKEFDLKKGNEKAEDSIPGTDAQMRRCFRENKRKIRRG